MNHARIRHSPLGDAVWSRLTLVLVLCALLVGWRVQAQPTNVLTNLAQITRALRKDNQIVADLDLNGTVFACNTNTGVVALKDSSGACVLELEGFNKDLQPGDTVNIHGEACFLNRGDIGIYVSSSALLNNDGTHATKNVRREFSFKEGRYPLRVDWFNQRLSLDLAVSCVPVGSSAISTNLIHGTRAECFQGFWHQLPNFQLFQPVKVGSITNIDLRFRVRDEMVGIRFEGYLEIPKTGNYLFTLRSDDGSRLWVGSPEVLVKQTGNSAAPTAPLATVGEPMARLDECRLVTLEGRVGFVTRSGKGLRLEVRSEHSSASVAIADSGSLEPSDLLNTSVRICGVAGAVRTESGRAVLGTLSAASFRELTVIENPPIKGAPPTVLRSIVQVHNLSNEAASNGLPVLIRGTVTTAAWSIEHWMVIQDETRGAFVDLSRIPSYQPRVGELWEIAGHTQLGGFAPVILAERATLLGKGQIPEPAHPTWGELANGSMDVQWVELRGLVTGVNNNRLSILLPDGRQDITFFEWGGTELKEFDNAVIRIRGTLFTEWEMPTHEARPGICLMHNTSISVETPPPSDPFDAPEKTPRGLFKFDAKATPLQRVKVHGQVTYLDSKCIFIEQGAGIEVHPRTNLNLNLRAGDMVETVGYPGLSAAGPQLQEALLRKTAPGTLPEAQSVSPAELPNDKFTSTRIRIEGKLLGHHAEGDAVVLQIQARKHLFPAHIADGRLLRSLRPGSKLALTGIYVPSVRGGIFSSDGPNFELLLNSASDVAILAAPSWWTLQRLLTAVGILLFVLALSGIWITLLQRQVAQRTSRLHQEIREREDVERQRALEAERSRIARDLHDELGTGLTEMTLLATVGCNSHSPEKTKDCVRSIADKARALVSALDVIVWAIDPTRNSLQSLADYIGSYAIEFLSASNIACRQKIPVEFAPVILTGAARHSLFLAVKETLNNIIRHASATEVELQISQLDSCFEIVIDDNGRGFDVDSKRSGHGLGNLRHRLESLRGQCVIESQPGKGTTVKFTVPFPQDPNQPVAKI